jgi:hypothetical protein
MAAAQKKSNVTPIRGRASKTRSIQGNGRKRSGKSHVSQLNEKCLANAHRHGLKWEDDEVSVLVNMIEDDKTTFDMAMKLGRSYYSAQIARSHVGFALRHENAIFRAKKGKR